MDEIYIRQAREDKSLVTFLVRETERSELSNPHVKDLSKEKNQGKRKHAKTNSITHLNYMNLQYL